MTMAPLADCAKKKCPGNSSEDCGDANRILVFKSHCPAPKVITNPSQSKCTDPAFHSLPFCNTALSFDARVADLVGRMTQSEKISLMGSRGTHDSWAAVLLCILWS